MRPYKPQGGTYMRLLQCAAPSLAPAQYAHCTSCTYSHTPHYLHPPPPYPLQGICPGAMAQHSCCSAKSKVMWNHSSRNAPAALHIQPQAVQPTTQPGSLQDMSTLQGHMHSSVQSRAGHTCGCFSAQSEVMRDRTRPTALAARTATRHTTYILPIATLWLPATPQCTGCSRTVAAVFTPRRAVHAAASVSKATPCTDVAGTQCTSCTCGHTLHFHQHHIIT